jgi:DNA-binding response OmpR family regulator
MGIETLTAKSRTEAAARFRKYKNRVDLVMMDAQIGNLDSVRLLATLRMSREKMPVVICSGHSKEKIEKMFSSSRIDGILIKPYTMSELKKILSKFLVLKKQ